MKTKEILFVTYQDENCEVGLSYAIYLAGMLGLGLKILLIGNGGLWARFDNILPSVASGECDGHKKATDPIFDQSDPSRMHLKISELCQQAGVKANIHTRLSSSTAVIRDFLSKPRIDMVLLSPTISKSNKFLKNLVKDYKRPVVTINQWGGAA